MGGLGGADEPDPELEPPGGADGDFGGAENPGRAEPGPTGGAEELFGALLALSFSGDLADLLGLDLLCPSILFRASRVRLRSFASFTTLTIRSWKFGLAPAEFRSKTVSVPDRSVVLEVAFIRSDSRIETAHSLLS